MNVKRLINNIKLTVKTIDNLELFFMDYFGFIKSDVIYKIRNKNIRFLARGGTTDKEEIIVVMSGYEYNFTKLPKLTNPVIYDAGAYIGDFAVYAQSYFKGSAKIYSFEPDDENYKYCQINLLLNEIQNVNTYHLALSSYNGGGFLQTKNIPADSFSLSNIKNNKLNCEVRTIHNISKQIGITKIDILKMDIEGGEYAVFEHYESYSFIRKNVKYLILEYHNLKNQSWKMKWLLDKTSSDFSIIHHQDNLLYLKNNKP